MTVDREPREVIREEPVMRGRILELLEEEPLTVPELAKAMDCPPHEVLFWVMGMRRFGRVREVGAATPEGYFRYGPVGGVGT